MSAQTDKLTQDTGWAGTSGENWVTSQALLDATFEPFEHRLVEAVSPGSGDWILDVGCGTGATVVAAARRLGDAGRVVGIDISAPMLEAARRRVRDSRAGVELICADAETHHFLPGRFDRVQSRFGMMFFADEVAALRNLLTAVTPGGRLDAVVWRVAEDNPFMTAAARAVAPILAELPRSDPDGPGQFRWGDAERVTALLADAGWRDIRFEPLDIGCQFPRSALESYLIRLGPVGRIYDQLDPERQRSVLAAMVEAMAPFIENQFVRFNAACWQIKAIRPLVEAGS
ncbi:hypothetical protein AWH62_03560 [Maricaulis sp. W15]|uniref:class I SAM-dependent methyltransferase n=1 Tax=Maricaulis sp. W15 TaxID=1772333 RepID=UPI000948FFB8|nr:class I SAM-dependent methyltransferase [Maricaulis sp. W15]OLF77762.1 hypothetical protein AWH62_03560 [Maricaulis sp. W15]